MKFKVCIAAILVFNVVTFAQSGRRSKPAPQPVATPEPTPVQPVPKQMPDSAPVTAEKGQEYRCTDDGTLAHILDGASEADKGFTAKEVDTKAEVTTRTEAKYTRLAREAGVQGYVTLKVLLSANGEIGRVKVVRRLPYGLTENAIRAACEIKFKPAMKDGQKVAQWIQIEYAFQLAKSSIFGP
jgi:TonB family protein